MPNTDTNDTAIKTARKISATSNNAAVWELSPPFVLNGETHERVIAATAFGETHLFPVFGRPRVVGMAPFMLHNLALKSIGYEVIA